MNEETKKRILKKGIIRSEEDWNRASQEHISLAELFLLLSESNIVQGTEETTEEDKIVFLNETAEINDICELKDFDKVQPNKTFESDAIQIGVPIKILPLIRQIYGEMREGK
jgi:hypothetical protein